MSNLVLRADRSDGLATLTINRPERLNALNVDVFAELRAHVRAIAANTEGIGLVILRGAGKCFSAGHDLHDLLHGENLPEPHFQGRTVAELADLPQPVITAVHGHCYTGALELALAGDLLVATQSAKFGDTHAKFAVLPIWGLSQRLPRRVGLPKAREMMFTCRTYSAQEAHAMGLANFVVPDAALDAELDSLARDILAQSWFSHRANKRLLRDTDGMGLSAGLAHESYATEGVGPDMQDRISAFTTRRK